MKPTEWDAERWSQVSAQFNRALDLASEERDALLRELQASAPEIAQAVVRMLVADAAFTTHTPPSASTILAGKFDPILPAGSRLGAYAIESCLGVGGMGRVYRANRVEGDVAQAVAIKCLRFPDRDVGFTRRFLRERRILARLTHAHIARFLDAGTDEAGQPFVVIEYVDGVTITEFASTHRLTLRARIELLLKVMDAVAYSHRQLIVHRDIKPGNVLVDAVGEPHLLDFGIAKSLAPLDGGVAADGDTAIEHRAFSLAHAAPEQLRDAVVGTACDVYALGVLAYELICEKPPLALTGLSYAEAERQILEVFPAPPSEKLASDAVAPDGSDGKTWHRALRGDLDNIVLHALKKEPNERYATVDAFIDDLRRSLNNEPISLRGGQRWYRMQRFARRHRVAVALAASLVLALLIGSVALWLQNRATTAQRDTAIAQRRRAEGLNALLLNAFDAADPSRNRGKEVTAREVLDQAARQVNDKDVDPATRVSLLTAVADVYRTLGIAKDSAGAATNATQQTGDIPALMRVRAWRALAQADLALNDIVGAEAALVAARSIALRGNQSEELAEAIERDHVALRIMIAQGHAPEALESYALLYARSKRDLGAANAVTIGCGVAYAEQLRIMRRTADSVTLVDELLRNIPEPKSDPQGVRLLGDRARLARDLAQPALATEYAGDYIAGVRALYGERHLYYISALDVLAKIERDNQRFDAAIDVHRQIVDILPTITERPQSTQRAFALNNFANTLRIAGRTDDAAKIAGQAVDMAIATLPAGHGNIAHYRTTLAEVLIDRSDLIGALEQLDKSEAIFAAADSANAPGVIRACAGLLRAETLLGLGRRDEAQEQFNRDWQKLKDRNPRAPCHDRGEQLRQRFLDVLPSDKKRSSPVSGVKKEQFNVK